MVQEYTRYIDRIFVPRPSWNGWSQESMNLLHMLSASLNCAMMLGGSENHLPDSLGDGRSLVVSRMCWWQKQPTVAAVRRDTKRTKMPWRLVWQPGRTGGWDGNCLSHGPVHPLRPIPGWETWRSQRHEPRGHWTPFICCQMHGDQRGRPCHDSHGSHGMVIVSSAQALAKCFNLESVVSCQRWLSPLFACWSMSYFC